MEPVAHERATEELAEHLRPVFESSPDGVYIWLDEEHWICNERFAELFGYGSAAELKDTPHLLQRLVHEDDQHTFAYHFVRRVG